MEQEFDMTRTNFQNGEGMRPEFPALVGITDVDSRIGELLLQKLAVLGFAGRVVGVGTQAPERAYDFLDFYQTASADVVRLFAECDVLISLAGTEFEKRGDGKSGGRDKDEIAELGTALALFDQVLEALDREDGPRKLILISSALVYGAYPNNPVPIGEEVLLRPNEGVLPAVCKAEIERRLRRVTERRPGLVTTTLRPALVTGEETASPLLDFWGSRLAVADRNSHMPVQFLHENDLVDALLFVLARDFPGPYNIAAEGWLTVGEVDALCGKRRLPLPQDALSRLLRRMLDADLSSFPPEALPYVQHSWVVSTTKLARAGFAPAYSNAQSFQTGLSQCRKERVGRRRQHQKRVRPFVLGTSIVVFAFYLLRRR